MSLLAECTWVCSARPWTVVASRDAFSIFYSPLSHLSLHFDLVCWWQRIASHFCFMRIDTHSALWQGYVFTFVALHFGQVWLSEWSNDTGNSVTVTVQLKYACRVCVMSKSDLNHIEWMRGENAISIHQHHICLGCMWEREEEGKKECFHLARGDT